MQFKIYPLENTNRLDEICRLFATGLAVTTKEQWIWKHYTDNGLPKGMILVAEAENGKLGGMFAMQPAYYYRGSESVLLVQTEDLVIDPECRGQGLMRKLYDYVMNYYSDMGAKALVSFSTNGASYPIFIKYGAENLGNMISLETPKTLVPRFWIKDNWENGEWRISITDVIPEQLFFEKKDSVWKLEKNQRFMEWKFQDNPEQKYNWLKIEYKNQLVGYIVFYVNKGRVRSAVNVCDWELKDCVNTKILGKAIRILQGFGHWVSVWGCMSKDDGNRWEQAGLTNRHTTQSHFVYHAIGTDVSLEGWHITKADSDN